MPIIHEIITHPLDRCEKILMLLPAQRILKSTLLLIIVCFSLVWANSSASGLFDWQEEPEPVKKESSLPPIVLKGGSDLAKDGDESSEKQIPVLLFFSMEHCPFCMEVEEDYLKPLLRNAEYKNKVIIRKIRIDGTNFVRDFKGEVREPNEFSEQYNVSMVPTLVMVNSTGKRIVPDIIGIRNSHYYSSELDDAIEVSTKKIREIVQR
jgi:thioredoxin-related protein